MADVTDVPPVGEVRAPGMDHQLYPFRALPAARAFNWNTDHRVALTVTVMIDYWELVPPEEASPDPRMVSPLGAFQPDWLTWSQHEYGNRVGIWRVLEVLDRYKIKPSVALGTAAIARYPDIIEAVRERNGCFMAHGTHGTRRVTNSMEYLDEMLLVAECSEALAKVTGQPPLGWCGQHYSESDRTPDLVGEAGFRYLIDWSNDDRPYKIGSESIVSLPAQAEWSDIESMRHRGVAPHVWADGVVEAFTVLHDEGGACFNLTLNPWIIGQPHRIRYLGDALSRIMGRKKTWVTTTDEVYNRAVAMLG